MKNDNNAINHFSASYSKVANIIQECGFELDEFMEMAQSARLLEADKETNQWVRDTYRALKDEKLLSAFWSMFQKWRTDKANFVGTVFASLPEIRTWRFCTIQVVVDPYNRFIVITDRANISEPVKFKCSFSWGCPKMENTPEYKRLYRTIRDTGMMEAIDDYIAKYCY